MTQEPPTVLRAGQVLAHQMAAGVPRDYRIALKTGQALHLVVEQKGIDVVVTVTSPDGATLVEVDTPSGDSGPESLVVVARQDGDHVIRLSPFTKGAGGAYELRVVDVRPATPADRQWIQATSGPEAARLMIAMIEGVVHGDSVVGAGIIVALRGDEVYVATARHVVQRAENLRVRFGAIPRDTFAAEVLPAAREGLDLALLRIRGVKAFTVTNLPFHILADPSRLRRGESLNHMGFGGRPWRSNVAADRFAAADDDSLFFESLTVSPGASGGGLFNARWELVGMIVADQQPEGTALDIRQVLDQVRQWGYDTQLRYTLFHATWIAFMSTRDGPGDAYIMRADGTDPIRLTDALTGRMFATGSSGGEDLFDLSWSPDGRSLLVVKDLDVPPPGKSGWLHYNGRTLGNVSAEIYRVGTDGSPPVNLTNHPAADYSPSWSPDGSRIAFVSRRSGPPEIYTMAPDGTNVRPVTRSSAAGTSYGVPVWSPDSTKLAFSVTLRERESLSDSEIHVVNADGSRRTRLTSDEDDVWTRPSWSPSGRQVAFASRRMDSDRLYREGIFIVNADGTNVVRLTPDQRCCWSGFDALSWSPDGSKILFSAVGGSNEPVAIWAAAVDRSARPTRLSDPVADWPDHSPAWSPDGRMIAFWSNRFGRNLLGEGPGDICVMNADGSGQTCITRGPETGDDARPVWSPFFR